MPKAEIIAIGTELLLGETQDTNTGYLARALRAAGIDLFRTQVIGDNPERIAICIQEALGRADIVITTGGLGPTVDDPTRQAAAAACNLQLVFHPKLWKKIRSIITSKGRKPTENQKRQAYAPSNAIIHDNPVGTAPAFSIEINNIQQFQTVTCLPGVPREMELIVAKEVIPYLRRRFQLRDFICIRTLHTTGMGEGQIDDMIADFEYLSNPSVGLTAHAGVVDIRIVAKSNTLDTANAMIAKVEKKLTGILGAAIFGTDLDTLEQITLDALVSRGWKLCSLEFGLDRSILTRLGQFNSVAYLGGERLALPPQNFALALTEVSNNLKADVAIGIGLHNTPRKIQCEIILTAPGNTITRKLTYTGPSEDASMWATNTALDILHRCAMTDT